MPTPKTLTVMESNALLDALLVDTETLKQKRKGIRNYTIGLLMLDAGLRVGEVVQLRIADLVFNSEPVMSIIISPEIAKNKRERTIPVSGRLRKAIKMTNRHCWSHHFNLGTIYAFHREDCLERLTTRQVERIIRAAAMKSLGRPIHPHQLRHTFASRLMRTVNARIVQELLGHKNISSTQIYTHPNSEDLKKAIETLGTPEERETAKKMESFLASDVPNRLDTLSTGGDM